ncbi:MAG TPA: hypothetical protein VFV50_01535, partial [Bdellovibrionales bacterium]|nr:hypothetical protein [Bdellovibrionales bacterium]
PPPPPVPQPTIDVASAAMAPVTQATRTFAEIPPPPPPGVDEVERTSVLASSRVQAYIDALKEAQIAPVRRGPDVDAVGKELATTFDTLSKELESKLASLSIEVGTNLEDMARGLAGATPATTATSATSAAQTAPTATQTAPAEPAAPATFAPAREMPEFTPDTRAGFGATDGVAGLTAEDFGAVRFRATREHTQRADELVIELDAAGDGEPPALELDFDESAPVNPKGSGS